jgi:hypothetical protein
MSPKRIIKAVVNSLENQTDTNKQIVTATAQNAVPELKRKMGAIEKRELYGTAGTKIAVQLIKLAFKATVHVLGSVKEATKYLIEHGTQVLHLSIAVTLLSFVYYTVQLANYTYGRLADFADYIQSQVVRVASSGKAEIKELAKSSELVVFSNNPPDDDEDERLSIVPYEPSKQNTPLENLPSNFISLLENNQMAQTVSKSVDSFMLGMYLSIGSVLVLAGALVGVHVMKELQAKEVKEVKIEKEKSEARKAREAEKALATERAVKRREQMEHYNKVAERLKRSEELKNKPESQKLTDSEL